MLEVVAALIRRGDRFLICRRSPERSRGGLWEFPGGKVEPGETKEEALCRELREELGIESAAGELFMTQEHVYPDLTIRLSVLEAEIVLGEPRNLEHSELAFVTAQEAARMPFCPADIPIVRRLADLSNEN